MRGYLAATRSPLVSFAVTLPLLLLYNVGLMMPGAREMNATDLLSRLVVHVAGFTGFLVVNGALVIASVVLMAVLIKRGQFRPKQWLALCVEGLAYGLAMGNGVVWLMGKAHLLGPAGGSYSIPQALSLSAGAGYWEELVFRLGLVGGVTALARWAIAEGKGKRWKVGAIAAAMVLVSSVAFSVAHYLGGLESPEAYTFWYRALSGVVFSAIFLLRGFAVAAYTHFLYDVVVMVF